MVVVNFNGEQFLPICLEAVLSQEIAGGLEVVVVDNGSSDGSRELMAQAFPAVRVLDAGRNLGFAAGNNLGIREARGRYIALLNNDTRVRPGWLAALISAAEADDRIGAVTAKLVFRDRPDVIQSAGTLLLSDGGGGDRGMGDPDRGQYERTEEVFGANGASALLRRQALDDVGLFDEAFFMYYEDTDLSWRMRLRGWKVVYEPAAVVEHVHAGSSREGSRSFRYHAFRNRLLMLVKNARMGLLARGFGAGVRRAGGGGSGGTQAPGLGLYGRVALGLFIQLPRMLARRWRIRRRRTVGDSEIERWLYPRARWDQGDRSG